jgi:hypothetical protein
MKLYSDLASWWPLMSPPIHYVEEAADLLPLLLEGEDPSAPRTLLELGSGGGSLAFHLTQHFTCMQRIPSRCARRYARLRAIAVRVDVSLSCPTA